MNNQLAVSLMLVNLLFGFIIGGLEAGHNTIPEVNQTLLNETYFYGYNIGVVETSQSILQTGLLPMFNVTEEGIEFIGNLNLTEELEWNYNHY